MLDDRAACANTRWHSTPPLKSLINHSLGSFRKICHYFNCNNRAGCGEPMSAAARHREDAIGYEQYTGPLRHAQCYERPQDEKRADHRFIDAHSAIRNIERNKLSRTKRERVLQRRRNGLMIAEQQTAGRSHYECVHSIGYSGCMIESIDTTSS